MISRLFVLFIIVISICFPSVSIADQRNDPREQAISDTLDLWREGKYEQMYNLLSHRGSMNRERFVSMLRDASLTPSCCHLKLNDFKLINEKRTTSKVFAKIGMEGLSMTNSSHSREFTLDHEEGRWKMRLADIKAIAGKSKNKKKK